VGAGEEAVRGEVTQFDPAENGGALSEVGKSNKTEKSCRRFLFRGFVAKYRVFEMRERLQCVFCVHWMKVWESF
jgi:hypothetical protein